MHDGNIWEESYFHASVKSKCNAFQGPKINDVKKKIYNY